MSKEASGPIVTIGDVVNESVDQSGPITDFVYIDISSIDRETKKIIETKSLELSQAPSRAKQILKTGDVLVSMTRPNLNAVALVPPKFDGAIGSTGFYVLRSKWMRPEFLLALVQTQNFIDTMSSAVQGALYPAVRPKDILAFEFSLETPAQQTRIVQKLDELLSDLDAGVAELRAAQKKLIQYRQSLLKAAVEGELTAEWRQKNNPSETGAQLLSRILKERRTRWEKNQLAKFEEQGKIPPKDWQKKYPEPVQPDTSNLSDLPDGWVWANIDQLSTVVRGASPRPAGDPRYFGGNIPWITVGSITRDDEVYLTQTEQFVTEAGKEASRYIEPETLLLTNSGATLGVPKITKIGGCINDGSVALLDIDDVTKHYLYWFLKTQTDHLRAVNQGAAQPNLNTDIVRRISVPLCPLSEQVKIIEKIKFEILKAKSKENTISLTLKQSTAQRQNILRAAFSGQLVSQDPNDEPANILLERIKIDLAKQANISKVRKTKAQKELKTMANSLLKVLTDANDWVSAQEAFRRCGVADGSLTERIEELYAELRDLDKTGKLLIETVNDKKGRKLHDRLKLQAS